MYFVKVTSTATKKNIGFVGETDICFYGKGEELVHEGGNYIQHYRPRKEYWHPYASAYGYKSEAQAKRSPFYKKGNWIDQWGMWSSEVEIVKVDF